MNSPSRTNVRLHELGIVLRRRLAYASTNAISHFKMVWSSSGVRLPVLRWRIGLRGNCVHKSGVGCGAAVSDHQLLPGPAARRAEFGRRLSDQAGRTSLLGRSDAKEVRNCGRVWRPDTGNGMAESTFDHRAMGAFDRSGHGYESRQYFQDRG